MTALAQLLEDQPALIGTLSAAIVGLVIALGINPTVGASVGALLTVVAGIWVRAKVFSARTVTRLVETAATSAVSAMTPEAAGGPGVVTTAGQAVVDQIVAVVAPTPPGEGV